MRNKFQGILSTAVVIGLCLITQVGAQEQSFQMEEFPPLEYEGNAKYMLQSVLSSRRCESTPSEDIKAYPQFTSSKPLYGKVRFYSGTLFPMIAYSFALDESQGTGKGYDRLYFDANRDFDLSNDPVVKKAPQAPAHHTDLDKDTFFEAITLVCDETNVTLIPRLNSRSSDYMRLVCSYPKARRGTIKIGDQEHQAILARFVLPGRYDHPFSFLILDDHSTGIDTLGSMHCVDGILYQCSATPNGDAVIVKPYEGNYGTMTIADPQKQYKKTEITNGWLLSKDKIVDLSQCPQKDDIPQIPVGDYMPVRIVMTVDNIQLGFGTNLSEETSEGPAYGIAIRKDKVFEYSLANQPEVRFDNPKTGQKITCGDDVRIAAAMVDAKMNTMLQGMENMKNSESINPTVVISDSTGKIVAEGAMPFG